MKWSASLFEVTARVALLIPFFGFSTYPEQPNVADIIVTSAPTYLPLAALGGHGDNLERFPQGAQLLLLHNNKARLLVEGFAASADANVGFDGETVLFAGKREPSDPWQIWELTLKDHSVRRLIAGTRDAIKPFYLPGGRLVYARQTASGFELTAAGRSDLSVTAAVDANAGSVLVPLTYVRASTIPTEVLADGRILFESGFPLGSGSTPELYLVYSDGSGVESYRCDHGAARWGGKQLASGDVVFTHGTSLARFTSPLAQEASIVAPRAMYTGGVVETRSADWLVSARSGVDSHYALKLWEPRTAVLANLLAISGSDLVDPVVVAARIRPRRHPTALHNWTYANMLALDARLSRSGDLKVAPASVRLEVQDAAGQALVQGTAPVEADGSFFVKTPADQPIRFSLLDDKGAVIRQEQGWFWIRRGEQRICVGCHTGPERSSENRVPRVLLRTTTPADLSDLPRTGATKTSTPGGD